MSTESLALSEVEWVETSLTVLLLALSSRGDSGHLSSHSLGRGLARGIVRDLTRALPRRSPVSQTGNPVHPPASPHGVFSAPVEMTRSDHSGIPNLVRVWLFQWGWYSIERAQELRASLNAA